MMGAQKILTTFCCCTPKAWDDSEGLRNFMGGGVVGVPWSPSAVVLECS